MFLLVKYEKGMMQVERHKHCFDDLIELLKSVKSEKISVPGSDVNSASSEKYNPPEDCVRALRCIAASRCSNRKTEVLTLGTPADHEEVNELCKAFDKKVTVHQFSPEYYASATTPEGAEFEKKENLGTLLNSIYHDEGTVHGGHFEVLLQ